MKRRGTNVNKYPFAQKRIHSHSYPFSIVSDINRLHNRIMDKNDLCPRFKEQWYSIIELLTPFTRNEKAKQATPDTCYWNAKSNFTEQTHYILVPEKSIILSIRRFHNAICCVNTLFFWNYTKTMLNTPFFKNDTKTMLCWKTMILSAVISDGAQLMLKRSIYEP